MGVWLSTMCTRLKWNNQQKNDRKKKIWTPRRTNFQILMWKQPVSRWHGEFEFNWNSWYSRDIMRRHESLVFYFIAFKACMKRAWRMHICASVLNFKRIAIAGVISNFTVVLTDIFGKHLLHSSVNSICICLMCIRLLLIRMGERAINWFWMKHRIWLHQSHFKTISRIIPEKHRWNFPQITKVECQLHYDINV